MDWLNVQNINWKDPISFAASYSKQDIALLYSGMTDAYTGKYSYLFLMPLQQGDTPSPATTNTPLPDWVGYIGYEWLLPTPVTPPSPIHLPTSRLIRYAHMLFFDHGAQTITHYARTGIAPDLPAPDLPAPDTPSSARPADVTKIHSNFSRARYEQSIRDTLMHIAAGDFYQANITRKFYGHFASAPDSFSIFQALAKASPAPYSAYIRHQDSAVISSSPESFLSLSPDGTITTRPIKGSARRHADSAHDHQIRESLRTSSKNLSENLMIVDLMRNDLSRVSLPQSVQVAEQSGLYSYATIHHLISTICAQKSPEASVWDVIRACFPPGSMTGAPKHAAIHWCAQQEQMDRGVYSGAIGWIGGSNTCELSVVIRTVLIKDDRFEFQVGGGIVADSLPKEEWLETLTKARGICAALGITEEILATL